MSNFRPTKLQRASTEVKCLSSKWAAQKQSCMRAEMDTDTSRWRQGLKTNVGNPQFWTGNSNIHWNRHRTLMNNHNFQKFISNCYHVNQNQVERPGPELS